MIDFGVAKATELDLTDQSLGDTGAIVGTPTYMSPEQADPTTLDIDTRRDIYSLGVMLYELLAGTPPLDPAQLKRGGDPGNAADGPRGGSAQAEHEGEHGRRAAEYRGVPRHRAGEAKAVLAATWTGS